MDSKEILKRLQLVDDKAKLMWRKYPVFTVVTVVAVAVPAFVLGAVIF